VTDFDNGDVNSSSFTTGFDNDDVTTSTTAGIQFDDVNSPLITETDIDDVTSSSISRKVGAEFDKDDLTSLGSTKFDEHDVNSSNFTTGFDKSPLTHGNLSVSNDFDNDDVTSTQFEDDDHDAVNSPLISTAEFDNSDVNSPLVDVNSSVSNNSDNDDVTTSISSTTQIHEVNSDDDVTVSSPIIDANSPVSSQSDDNDVHRETYTCRLPTHFRRRLPFRQPVLTHSKDDVWVTSASLSELLRWNYIVYDVIDNEKDENGVVLLAKGINNRQGVNRSPKEFRCLFGDDLVEGVLTEVSSSLQEVFRCQRPDLSRLTAFSQSVVLKASLVIVESNHVVPSIAYYEPKRSKVVKEGGNGKKLLCACTMVYNVAKFLKEWVIYHANIGVEKFVLYDNGSDDDLDEVVKVLKSRGYDVEVRFWLWPKTQEAGYSHAVFVDKGSCNWMMYIDVDEFVYSPRWKSLKPSKGLLPALLPSSPYGQVMIKCYEFGPSGQKKHPLTGRVFLYASISIIFFITIHHLTILPSSSSNPHLLFPNHIPTQNDAVSEKLYQDNKIAALHFHPIIQTHNNHDVTSSSSSSSVSTQFHDHHAVNSPLNVRVLEVTDFDNGDVNSSSFTTGFDNDDVTTSTTAGIQFDDVNSPLITQTDIDDVTSSSISRKVGTEFDNHDVTTSTTSSSSISTQFDNDHHAVNSPLDVRVYEVTDFDNGDVNSSSFTTGFHNDDVTTSTTAGIKFDDVNSPLNVRVYEATDFDNGDVNSSNFTTGFDNDDVTTSTTAGIKFDDVNSPLNVREVTDFDNGDVNSSSFTTGFDNDDVTTSTTAGIQFDDVNSPVITQTDIDDVTSSSISRKVGAEFDNDDVTSLGSTKFDEHDVNSSNFTTGSDKSPLTHGNASVSNDSDNDDVTSTQFEVDDHDAVNSPLISTPEFDNTDVNLPLVDVNSSVSTNSDNDDVTTSISSTTQIHEVNSGTDDVTSTISAEFDNDDVNLALVTELDDDVTVSSPIIDANSPFSSQSDDNDDVTVIANVNVSVLFPAWEALVIVKSDDIEKNKSRSFYCLFDTNEVAKAKFAGTLSFSRETYTCRLPARFRRRLPFRQPVLTHSKDDVWVTSASLPELLRWNYIVYDVIDNEKDENDVVLLAKGINNRQGVNRSPKEFRCLFGDDLVKGVLTEEWVIYHANIGVEKFVLYDNGSDDDLDEVVKVLKSRGYDVEVRFWLWPKTQEAGYSHAAFVDKGSCKWMMYIDVDEFVYSPKWKSLKPSKGLLSALLPSSPYGQVMIKCYEFGPSGQKKHPLTGVTQGYNCRKEVENRHKSIVLLDAVHESLLNMIHHFKLKDGYKSMKVEFQSVAVNHYKYQAWVEFKAKFRRRVSAYVVDWTRSVNLKSNDRAPGLGYSAVKPDGWEDRFCEVHDNRLRDLTRRWFGRRNRRSGVRMAWAK
nr:glycosyltransferase family 92 protein-like [Tanacetum cinerariifolium]